MPTTRSLVLILLQSALLLSCSGPDSGPASSPDPVAQVSSGYLEVNSVELYYEITGDGEPLLLLHGGLGGSDYFAKIIPPLSESFKIITFDRRGHGRSHDSGEPYTYAAFADEAAAFLDHLHLESVNLLGFSDGGVVAYHLASTYPKKVRRLAAVGANFRVDGMTDEAIDFTKNRLTPEGLRETYPGIEREYRATNPQPENFESFLSRSNELWLRDPYLTEEQMTGIEAPVLFIVGEKDAVRIEHVLLMRSLVENSEMCVLPGATHFVLADNPKVVLPILMDFFGDAASGLK